MEISSCFLHIISNVINDPEGPFCKRLSSRETCDFESLLAGLEVQIWTATTREQYRGPSQRLS